MCALDQASKSLRGAASCFMIQHKEVSRFPLLIGLLPMLVSARCMYS